MVVVAGTVPNFVMVEFSEGENSAAGCQCHCPAIFVPYEV